MNVDACAKHCRKHISRLFYFGGYTRVRSGEMKLNKINAKSKKSICFILIFYLFYSMLDVRSASQLTYTASIFQETNHQRDNILTVGFSRSTCTRLSNSSTPPRRTRLICRPSADTTSNTGTSRRSV